MKRFRQFLPVIISDFEISVWKHPVHNHNHYELIYIKNGTGLHHLNKELITYKQGDIFLLGPDDQHYFEIRESTRFIFLKFTDFYLHGDEKIKDQWVQEMEYLIKNRETRLSGFKLNAADQAVTAHIYEVIIGLNTDIQTNERLIWLQIMAIATILRRNLPEVSNTQKQLKDMENVFAYIHEHIYTPDRLKAEVMARHFHTTAAYIGPFFKRNAGLTMRDYIGNYRRTLIQKRMSSGNYSLKQIVSEFGLTDESHVSKLLKTKQNT
ncbi:YesN/AraC family two-component response regulator [Pedobacter cryoconitis]|uniref:YesN/AraC family two-component response regulator n=1 Tax=Pedobacter cryoconitis TaxID=188932 RepID=A0A7W8ZQ91_9SPHI|nr:AraC family ligand binding domain-containing protein [Pedobacter cryoconitis]MBB5638208.1 YesN/AraC family two-component response regulator [Pedobacter cryoconitis]MBB6271151.1 YesN/AraC family two-component response regulator [Pedobacter cryoconitis]